MKNIAKIFVVALAMTGFSSGAFADEASLKAAKVMLKELDFTNKLKAHFAADADRDQEPAKKEFEQRVKAQKVSEKCVTGFISWETAQIGKIMNENMDKDQLETVIGDIYANAFTADEIVKLTGFYKTPTGQKILTGNVREVTQADKDEIAKFAQTPAGKKNMESMEGINKKIVESPTFQAMNAKFSEEFRGKIQKYKDGCPALEKYLNPTPAAPPATPAKAPAAK